MVVHVSSDPDFWDNAPPARRDSQERAKSGGWGVSIYALGADPNADDIPLAALLWIPSGEVLERHAHSCHRVEVIVKGSLDIGGRVLHPGDVSTSNPGDYYGPHTAGPEGSLSVEIFSHASGLVGLTPDGERTTIQK